LAALIVGFVDRTEAISTNYASMSVITIFRQDQYLQGGSGKAHQRHTPTAIAISLRVL
jgi:hypothetical protein